MEQTRSEKNKFKACQVCYLTRLSFKVAIYSHWQATMLGKKPSYLEEWISEGVHKLIVSIIENLTILIKVEAYLGPQLLFMSS